MPEPNTQPPKTPQGPGEPGWFADAPGGDIDFDSLFANPELADSPQPTTVSAEPSPVSTPQTISTPISREFFLDVGTSKYKTQEEAIRGISEKDRLIDEYRKYRIEKEGFDPLTGKTISKQQPQAVQTNGPVRFSEEPKAYGDALVKAIEHAGKTGDWRPYLEAQKQLARETAEELLAPYAPVVQGLANERAVEQAATGVSAEVNTLRSFISSDAYNHVLEDFPSLKASIETAKIDPRGAPYLPEFYRMAYKLSLGTKSLGPTLVPSNISVPTVRPTTTTTTMTPLPTTIVQQSGRPSTDELMRTPEGRKQLIEEGRAKGVENLKF